MQRAALARGHTHTEQRKSLTELTRTRPQSQFISARELLCATRRIEKKAEETQQQAAAAALLQQQQLQQ